jgi:hypothetical protein
LFIVPSGARLSPLGTAATVWPILPAPDDIWWWFWSNWWNEDWQEKPKYSEQIGPSATLSTTNPTWPGQGPNLGSSDGKPATNRLSYGVAILSLSKKLIITQGLREVRWSPGQKKMWWPHSTPKAIKYYYI